MDRGFLIFNCFTYFFFECVLVFAIASALSDALPASRRHTRGRMHDHFYRRRQVNLRCSSRFNAPGIKPLYEIDKLAADFMSIDNSASRIVE